MKACIGPSGKLLWIWQTIIMHSKRSVHVWLLGRSCCSSTEDPCPKNCANLFIKQFLLLGCPHSSVDLFAPSILLPQVRIPSILSTLLSIDIRIVTCTTDEKNQKEAGICIGPFLTILAALVQIVSCRMLLIITIMIMIIGWWLHNAQIRIFLTCRYRRAHKIETCVFQCDQIENFYTIWPIGIKKICLMATKK